MVNVSLVLFLAISQALLLTLVALGICIYRERKSTRLLNESRRNATELAKRRDISAYLAQEIAQCQQYIDRLGVDKPDTSSPDLRLRLLALEQQLSVLPDHDDAYWKIHADVVSRVLAEYCPGQAPREEADREGQNQAQAGVTASDEIDAKEVLEGLISKVTNIRNLVAETVSEDAVKENINLSLDGVTSTCKDISACIYTFEDENGFLREQVAALLKL